MSLAYKFKEKSIVESLNDLKEKYIESINKNITVSDRYNLKVEKTLKLFDRLINEVNEINKLLNSNKKIVNDNNHELINLDVGGTHFTTLKSTLTNQIQKPDKTSNYRPHKLSHMINENDKINEKSIFIDRSPKYFEFILEYLRAVNTGIDYQLPKLTDFDREQFIKEVEYYEIDGLKDLLSLFKQKENILNQKDLQLVTKNFEDKKKTNSWKLIYKASVDGFSSDAFHSKSDNQSNTLVLIESQNGNIFGGFTDESWDISGNYKYSTGTALFTFNRKTGKIKKYHCKLPKYAIYCDETVGPSFGYDTHDLFISSNSNLNANSYTSLKNTYGLEEHFDGIKYFQVKEIEIYQQL